MSEKVIIHCDKCDSENVLHEQIKLKQKETHKKMSEVAKENMQPMVTYDVYHYTHYKMVCKDCGYILQYRV